MPRTRQIANPLPEKDIMVFHSAEEAWFWFIRSERARMEGARFERDATPMTRPCEPDDIYRAVMRLHKKRVIGQHHLKTLARFGWRECPPDARVRHEQKDVLLWDDALDRLSTELKAKGIVEHDPHAQSNK